MTPSALDGDATVRHSPDLVVEAFEDAILVWDEAAARLHHLDSVAAVVWDELDGTRTLREVATGLARDLRGDADRIAADVADLAATLVAEGLLQTGDPFDGAHTDDDGR
jgi:hypothetical protein